MRKTGKRSAHTTRQSKASHRIAPLHDQAPPGPSGGAWSYPAGEKAGAVSSRCRKCFAASGSDPAISSLPPCPSCPWAAGASAAQASVATDPNTPRSARLGGWAPGRTAHLLSRFVHSAPVAAPPHPHHQPAVASPPLHRRCVRRWMRGPALRVVDHMNRRDLFLLLLRSLAAWDAHCPPLTSCPFMAGRPGWMSCARRPRGQYGSRVSLWPRGTCGYHHPFLSRWRMADGRFEGAYAG